MSPYNTLFGDVNGDGIADVVWSNMIQTAVNIRKNTTYIAFGKDDGSFDLSTADGIFDDGAWGKAYRFHLADFNGYGKDDIAWNELSGKRNRTYTALSEGNTSGSTKGPFDKGAGGWTTYQTFFGGINGDGKEDLIGKHKKGNAPQAVHTAHGKAGGSIRLDIDSFAFQSTAFGPYDFAAGDIDGDNLDDVINTKKEVDKTSIWMAFSNGNTIESKKLQRGPELNPNYFTLMEDVDLDGRCNIIWNELTSNSNSITLGLVNSGDRAFTFNTEVQKHNNQIDWTVYERPTIADIGGNGKPICNGPSISVWGDLSHQIGVLGISEKVDWLYLCCTQEKNTYP